MMKICIFLVFVEYQSVTETADFRHFSIRTRSRNDGEKYR
jgi:hypothetical protein